MQNKKFILFASIAIVSISGFVLLMPFGKETKTNTNTKAVAEAETKSDSNFQEKKYLNFTQDNLPQMTKSEWPVFNELYVPYLSNDLFILEKFPDLYTEHPEYLIIFPKYLDYNFELSSVCIEDKNISVEYTTGNSKIPKVVGHEQVFSPTIFKVELANIKDAVYSVDFYSSKQQKSSTKKIDYRKIQVPMFWEVRGLSFSQDNQLIFSSNKTGNWQLWGYDLGTEQLTQLTNRHSDLPNEILSTLGSENFNIQYPIYNAYENSFIYHSGFDIYKVNSNGDLNIPLTLLEGSNPSPDQLETFEVNPITTLYGDKIIYKHSYEPMKNELYFMDLDGENKTKINIPEKGYVDIFDVTSDTSKVVVSTSNKESEYMDSSANIWTIDLKDKSDFRKLHTGAYSTHSLDISPNDHTLAISLKQEQATSHLSTDIWTINLNNTELTQLTPLDNRMDIKPVWSPDGNSIAFLSGNGEYFDLFVMNKDGSNRRKVNQHFSPIDKPIWSLDGTKLYSPDRYGFIYEIDLISSTEKEIVKGVKY